MADEDEVVVLEHPDVKDEDGNPLPMTFRQSDGFWSDKQAQIEVFRAGGWVDAPKTRFKAAAAATVTPDQK